MSLIRISIVEDDDQARASLAVLFNGTLGFRCVSIHPSTEDALKKLPIDECDVAIVDLRKLTSRWSPPRIVNS